MMKDSIGIDVSKDHLDVYCLGDGRAARFGNDAPGLRKFKAWLPQTNDIARVVYEGEGTAITDLTMPTLSGALAACCRWSK
jgi:transposase